MNAKKSTERQYDLLKKGGIGFHEKNKRKNCE
jgi:hypothetical protein